MSEATATLPVPLGRPRAAKLAAAWRARFDDLGLALSALASHKLRSGLTLLGVVIGVFTVVSMMALLTGLQKSIDAGLGGLGADVFQLQKWPEGFHMGRPDPAVMRRKNITLQQTIQLREQLPTAKQVGAEVWDGGKELTSQHGIAQGAQVAGGTAEFFTNNALPIGRGRGWEDHEATSAARNIVLGNTLVETLFPNQEPLGQKVRLGRVELTVVGTLAKVGNAGPFGGGSDTVAAIPIGLFFELYGTGRSINITVMARDHESMRKLQDQAVAAFRRVRGTPPQDDNDFDLFSNDSVRATFESLAGIVNAVMLAVCGLSLLVGGIGVMNIMLVAVAERTREIGLRKALGARRSRILTQFVVEAVLLASFGGLIGIGLGYAASALAHAAFALPSEVPLWSVALGLGVSCGIGLVFGIYPAARASRLDPAVALRDE